MYYIVYPRGDKTKLCIVNIDNACLYEIHDYAVASRKEFQDDDKEEVIDYAKNLAQRHNLKLSSNCDEINKELNYLD